MSASALWAVFVLGIITGVPLGWSMWMIDDMLGGRVLRWIRQRRGRRE